MALNKKPTTHPRAGALLTLSKAALADALADALDCIHGGTFGASEAAAFIEPRLSIRGDKTLGGLRRELGMQEDE